MRWLCDCHVQTKARQTQRAKEPTRPMGIGA
eukprot:COSAG01_NODE_15439_length_1337_cov_1.636511_3_plen_30_part_01